MLKDDDRRFDRGAWRTLAIALFWFVFTPCLMLTNFQYPSDGWTNYKVQNGGGYSVGMNVTGKSSPLQKGDLVVAIDGQLYREDPLHPCRRTLRSGKLYTTRSNAAGKRLRWMSR